MGFSAHIGAIHENTNNLTLDLTLFKTRNANSKQPKKILGHRWPIIAQTNNVYNACCRAL